MVCGENMSRKKLFFKKGYNVIHGSIVNVSIILKKRVLNLRISSKLLLFYLILLVISITLSNYLFQKINSGILEKKIGEASVQTLDTISSGFDTLFDNINNYSKMLLSNNEIQKYLVKNDTYKDYEATRDVTNLLAGYLQVMPNISSIYLFDNDSNMYALDPHIRSPKKLKIESIQQANWYEEALKYKGKSFININAGGIFANDKAENYVSFIRIINDLQSNKPIGTMIINIPAASLKATFQKAISGNDVYIAAIYKGETIIDFENFAFDLQDFNNQILKLDHNATLLNMEKKLYLVSSINSDESSWRLVSVMPFSEVNSEYKQFNLTAFVIILLNSIFLFIGTILISKLITTPITRLLDSMKMVENGEFHQVHFTSGNDEIGELRDGYNDMVLQMQRLIKKILEEQKFKRKAELAVLQEQIKPHFLYNSLDAIAYMALVGEKDEAYNVIIALSNYYRNSLSKGSEVITVFEEVDIVRNYLTIQKVRFPGMIIDEYDIDESVGNFKILKLILQPLVENSVHHGIRPKGEAGRIIIRVKKEEEWLKISVEDDGIGMNEEELSRVMDLKIQSNLSSFGLRGTIERLKIFYGCDNIYHIWSEKGQGTVITITLPYEIISEETLNEHR